MIKIFKYCTQLKQIIISHVLFFRYDEKCVGLQEHVVV